MWQTMWNENFILFLSLVMLTFSIHHLIAGTNLTQYQKIRD